MTEPATRDIPIFVLGENEPRATFAALTDDGTLNGAVQPTIFIDSVGSYAFRHVALLNAVDYFAVYERTGDAPAPAESLITPIDKLTH